MLRPFLAIAAAVLAPHASIDAQTEAPSPGFRLQRLVSIGGDDAPVQAAFMDVAGIGVSRAGDIYVLDAGNRSIRVFDAGGRHLRSFGRRGGGPGELEVPVWIGVDTVVRVSDMAQRRTSFFDLQGRHLGSEPAPEVGTLPALRLRPLRHGRAIGVTPARMQVRVGSAAPEGSLHNAVVVLGRGGAADTLIHYHSGAASFHPRDAAVPFGTVTSHLGQGGAHAVLGDSVVATADGYTGTVRWYRVASDRLELFRTRQLPSRSRPRSDDDLRRVERQVRREGPTLPRRLVIDAPERVSVATQALFSDEGMLWVRSTAEGEGGHVWTVFGADGEVAYRLRLPPGFELRHVRGDRLYGSARTAADAPVVHVYRLVRGG